MGCNHLRILNNLDGVDLVGVYDPGISDKKIVKQGYFKKSMNELLSTGLDYAVVSVPTVKHEEIALNLASKNIHALIEKPLSFSRDSAARVQKAFAERELIGAVGHIERFNPAVLEAKKRLKELGVIYQITTRREGPFPGRISDVGTVKDLASHDIDITEWITNQKYDSVYAQTAHQSGRPNEDLVLTVGSLDRGIKFNHIVNWLSPRKIRSIEILGANGAFEIDTLNADLKFFKNGTSSNKWSEISHFRGVSEGDAIKYSFEKKEPLLIEHENFRDAILKRKNNAVSLLEGVRVLEVAEAIITSSQQNCVIKI